MALVLLGDLCFFANERLRSCYEASLALFHELDTQLVVAGPLHNLGFVALETGDDARCGAVRGKSCGGPAAAGPGEVATALGGLAAVAATRGALEQAARIFGAMEGLLAEVGEQLDHVNRVACDHYCAAVRSQPGEASFAASYAEGCARPVVIAGDEWPKSLEMSPAAPIGEHQGGRGVAQFMEVSSGSPTFFSTPREWSSKQAMCITRPSRRRCAGCQGVVHFPAVPP